MPSGFSETHLRRHDAPLGVEQRESAGTVGRQLNRYFRYPATLPSERIEDDDRNALLDACIDLRGKGREGIAGNLVGRPVNLVIILLRFLVDDADAGPRREIMELVEQDMLPGTRQFFRGIWLAIQPRQRGILLSIEQPLFAVRMLRL